ncbi:hypothetical protein [Microcoleus sp.]|uniref:hypothetical protein n=1 Tax=Microcoleus sp. TaxID=44472 RepID=UPI0035935CBA
MRFRYHKYTQKPGFWLQQQILPVQTPISMRQKAIDRRRDATVKLLLVGRYGSEIDGQQPLPAGASQQVTEAIVASARCSNGLCGCRCFTCSRRY